MSEQPLNRLQYESKLPSGFSNEKAKGKMPEELPSPLMLNLGCGNDIREEFINIDLYSDSPEVVYMDIRNIRLPDNSVDVILANDVLEHFSHRETGIVLKEWHRVLKPGGEMLLRVPSLRLQMKAYMENKWSADIASYMIFGGQTNPGDYHCVGFDAVSIKRHLENAGFVLNDLKEYDLPQDKGFINLNMSVKATKKAEDISEEAENQSNLFDGLDFESVDDNNEQTNNKEANNFDTENDNEYDRINDIELLENIVDNENNPLDEDINPKESDAKKSLNVVWEGSQFINHSLALINREHSYNIIKTGLTNVTIVPFEDDTFDAGDNEKYKILKSNDIRYKPDVPDEIASLPYVWIRHQWPPKAEPPKGAKWIIMQPWEYSRLRKDVAEILKMADEVWTPSAFSRQSIIDSGIDNEKVQIIPNGIDPKLFKPNGRKYPLETKKKLKLLFVGGTMWRKGFDLLLETYSGLFTDEDDITLVVKDMGNKTFYKGQTAEDLIKGARLIENSPEIIYMNEDLNEEEMAALYRSCDLLVSPYRGEGFSLPVLEAMASGVPVMVTKGGPTDDFTSEEFAIYIDSEKMSVGDEIQGHKLTDNAYVHQPDKEHFTKLLKIVYEKPNILKPMGLQAQQYAREYMTWNKATLRIFSRLDYLYDMKLGKDAQKILQDDKDDYILLGKAEKYFAESMFDDAKYLYEKIKEESLDLEHRLLIYIRLADINIAYDEIAKAEEFILKAQEIDIPSPDRDFLLAMLDFKNGNSTEALEMLTELMKEWINIKFHSIAGISLDDILMLTGDILFEEDDLEGAQHLYTEALKYNPENSLACYGAGKVFKKAGAEDEAKQMFEWALKISPGFEEAEMELKSL